MYIEHGPRVCNSGARRLHACHSGTSSASVYARRPAGQIVTGTVRGRVISDPRRAGRSRAGEHGRPMSRLTAPSDSFLMGCPSNRHRPGSLCRGVADVDLGPARRLGHSSRRAPPSVAAELRRTSTKPRRSSALLPSLCRPFHRQSRPAVSVRLPGSVTTLSVRRKSDRAEENPRRTERIFGILTNTWPYLETGTR